MSDRIRVKDKDTGHERTIAEHMLPHGNYQVLKRDAVDPATGEDLPPVYSTDSPSSGESTAGQKATEKKES
jgi:hypothetical protein